MTGVLPSRLEQAAWVLAEVGSRRDAWSPERHRFIERWAGGSLTQPELRAFAGEQHLLAVALADATHRAADLASDLLFDELRRQARVRDAELSFSFRFALATGWPRSAAWTLGADPLPQTAACERLCTAAGAPLAERLVALYALETACAAGAARQLGALVARYGFDDGAVGWFRARCAGADGPAGMLEAALTGLLPVPDPFALVRRAELVCHAYWDLLDGVELCGRATLVA